MPLRQRITTLVIAFAISAPSIAGVEKESRINRSGLFFAWLAPDRGHVLVGFDSPNQLRELAQHCNSGNEVFSLERGTKYKCKFEVFKLPSGEVYWESAGATVVGPAPKSDTWQFGLFSTRPPTTTRWIARPIAPQELETLLKSDARWFAKIKRQLKPHKASVVSRPGGLYSTVIVPGRIVEDREAFYYAQRHHVFVKQDNVYTYLGEIPGKPTKFVDIDGKDFPGFVVEEGCDGWCISLWSLAGELRKIGTFGGH